MHRFLAEFQREATKYNEIYGFHISKNEKLGKWEKKSISVWLQMMSCWHYMRMLSKTASLIAGTNSIMPTQVFTEI